MILHNLDIDEYHRHRAVSNSKLKDFRSKGPAYFHGRYATGKIPPHPATDAFRIGRAFDCMVFEPKEFPKRFVIRPEIYTAASGRDAGKEKPWNGNATVCKDWIADAAENGLEVVSPAEWAMFNRMRIEIMGHPAAKELLSKGEAQVSIRHDSPKYGLEIQTRPDWLSLEPCALSRGLPYLVDLKTTRDWGHGWFDPLDPHSPLSGRAVFDFGYHRQAAIAQKVAAQEEEIGPTAHFLLVVEKQEPYRVGVVRLSDTYLDMGWRAVSRDLERLADCKRQDIWPNGPEGVVTVGPQDWMQRADGREREVAEGDQS